MSCGRRSTEGALAREESGPPRDPLTHSVYTMTGARLGGLGTLIFLAALCAFVYTARDVLVLVLVAVLLAHAVMPLVRLISPTPGRGVPRALAAVLVLLLTLSALGYFIVLLVPLLATDLSQMIPRVPDYVRSVQELLARVRVSQTGAGIPQEWWEAMDASLSQEMGSLAAQLGHGAVNVVRGSLQALGLVIIPILAFHVMRDGERITTWLVSLIPARSRGDAQSLMHDIDQALAAYVRGQAVVCLTMGVVVTLFLYIARVPYAPLLGTLAMLAEAIPYVGALIVCIVYAIVGLSVSPTLAVVGPVGYLVVNQLVGLLITPRLMGQHLSIHPMVVLLAVLLGAQFGGFVGMLLALPGAAIAKVLVDRWREVARRS